MTIAFLRSFQIIQSGNPRTIASAALLILLLALPSNAAYAACASPAGNEGDVLYNTDFKVVQFCDGTNWMSMSGTASTTDARIGTLTASKWCATNAGGTAIDCTQNAPAASAGTDKQIIFNDGGSTLAGAATLYWDKTSSKLSVNAGTTPTEAIDVTGKITANAFKAKGVTGAAAPISGSSYWASNGTDVWRAIGNVGIGTTSPTAKLEIGGTAGVDGIKFPDGTTLTTAATSSGGAYQVACIAATSAGNLSMCCQVTTSTGATSCKYNSSIATSWTAFTYAPFIATSTASYSVQLGGGSTYNSVCRINNQTGATSCVYNTGPSVAWTAYSYSPF